MPRAGKQWVMRLKTHGYLVFLLASSACAAQDQTTAQPQAPYPSRGQVTIYRDEWGVPNIYAIEERGGYFGLGYAVAEDSAERLYLGILAARGELAATVAPAELSAVAREQYPDVDALIENDYQAKLWRIREEATRSVSRLLPALREDYAAFAGGVKAFARAHPDRVPSWAPRDIEVADVLAVGHWLLWLGYQAGVGLDDCQRGGVEPATYSTAKRGTDPRERVAMGSRRHGQTIQGMSNAWALMPRHTATGGAILLSDPHGGIRSVFYEYRLHAGGFQASGFSDGAAMPLLLRNARVGWAMTTGSPDVADCYRVNTTSAQNATYLFDGQVRKIESAVIKIGVKGRSPEQLVVKFTRHNGVYSPVVRELPGAVYVVSTPYLLNMEGLHNSLYLMAMSSDVDGFKRALSGGGMFPQNLVAADTRGDILYVRAGLTPRRPAGTLDWTAVLDGNSSQTAWRGIHPAEDLLSIKSPATGYLQNNNVSPRFMSDPPPAALSGMPVYLYEEGRSDGEVTSRALAALRAFEASPRLTREDAFNLALSVELVDEHAWVEMLRIAVSGSGIGFQPDEPRGRFITELLSFDGKLSADSTHALKYIYFRQALRPHLTPQDISNLSEALDVPGRLSARLRGLFIGAIDTALDNLLAMPGGLDRAYGDEFRLRTGEGASAPMSGGNLATIDSFSTPAEWAECAVRERLCGTSLLAMFYSAADDNGQRFVEFGSRIMRLDFYSPRGIESYSLQNSGQAAGDGSPHSHDQGRQLLSQRKLKKVYFEWQELREHVASKLTLHVPSGNVVQ